MANTLKFEGGTRLTTFRLPVVGYEEVRAAMNKVLDSFRDKRESPGGETFLHINTDGKPIWPGITNPKEKLHIKKGKGIPEGFSFNSLPEKVVDIISNKITAIDPEIENVFQDFVVSELHPIELKNEWEVDKLLKKEKVINFPCGCFQDSVLFRRQDKCKFGDFKAHKEKYGI